MSYYVAISEARHLAKQLLLNTFSVEPLYAQPELKRAERKVTLYLFIFLLHI